MIYNYKEFINNINIKGVIHIGSINLDELNFYNSINIKNIIWIDAYNTRKIKDIYNYNALITDHDNIDYNFNISNNGESSSILDFKKLYKEHPDIFYKETIILKSITLDSFYKKNNIDQNNYNMWNICIQGCELMALKGSKENIKNIHLIYIKIYTKELYNNCPLIKDIDSYLNTYSFKRMITEINIKGSGIAIYVNNTLKNKWIILEIFIILHYIDYNIKKKYAKTLIVEEEKLYEYVEKLYDNIEEKKLDIPDFPNIRYDEKITSIYGEIPNKHSDVDKLKFYEFILYDIANNIINILDTKLQSLNKDYNRIVKLNIDYTNFISNKISSIIENTDNFDTEQNKPLHRKNSYI